MRGLLTKNHQTFHLHILILCRDSTSIHLVYNHVLSRLSYRNRPSVSSLVSTFSMLTTSWFTLLENILIWPLTYPTGKNIKKKELQTLFFGTTIDNLELNDDIFVSSVHLDSNFYFYYILKLGYLGGLWRFDFIFL